VLTFLDCPKTHWWKVRTTNAIERAFREVRRRTRPMSCFQNSASVDRIIYGVISHLYNDWKERSPCLNLHTTLDTTRLHSALQGKTPWKCAHQRLAQVGSSLT